MKKPLKRPLKKLVATKSPGRAAYETRAHEGYYPLLNAIRETLGLDPLLDEIARPERFARSMSESSLRLWEIQQSTPIKRSSSF